MAPWSSSNPSQGRISNNEVAYNSFIDCSDHAEWTGGNCDGGATEVAIGGTDGPTGGGLVTGLKIHHNLAVNTCGFFEVSSMGNLVGIGGGIGTEGNRGTFSDSAFYNNVIIDSGWLSLLQVSNTDLDNIRWENNTLVQHKGSGRDHDRRRRHHGDDHDGNWWRDGRDHDR